MYVLVHKERVLVGPRNWNRAMFDGALEKLKISFLLPLRDPQELPIIIDDDTYVTNASLTIPPHNEKIESYHGPYWDFSNKSLAVGTYGIQERPIGSIQEIVKNLAAAERYRRETSGTRVTIQDLEVFLDTSREGRNIFIQANSMMGNDDTINWKFSEGWLTLTKSDMNTIVSSINQHIQAAFNWEKSKIQEVEAATTAAELDAIVITEE